jgi:hypothetical protein
MGGGAIASAILTASGADSFSSSDSSAMIAPQWGQNSLASPVSLPQFGQVLPAPAIVLIHFLAVKQLSTSY